ncbi:helix-turn-helix domain-containing protein [Cobetia sp. D5]|uniref:helix-turn-helix domain-containing protein n=1 Tax=Cobetia sp. D5 TaxID=3105867 RepID=UPI003FA46009
MLDTNERSILREFTQQKKGRRESLRAAALLMIDEGHDDKTVAIRLGVRRESITKWKEKWQVERLGLLRDKQRPGRPPRFSDKDMGQIAALLLEHDHDLVKVQFYFEANHGKKISLTTLRRFQRSDKLSPYL